MKDRILSSLIFMVILTFYPMSLIAEGPGITVGVSVPLSGDLAEYGAAVRNGIILSISDQPDKFSNVHFVFEDNQYNAAKAIAAFRKLHEVDKIQLLYNWGEPTLHAIAPITEKAQFPVIAMSLDPEPSIGKRYIIRSINHSDQYAEKLVNYMRSEGWKRIAVVKTEDPFLNSMIKGIKKYLKTGESLTVVATVAPPEHDFKTHITKLKQKQKSFDVLGVYLFSGQVSAFYRQAAAQQLTLPTFGTDFFESKKEINDSQGSMNGAVYPNIDVPEVFRERYAKRFKSDTQIAYAYNAYLFSSLTANLFNDGAVIDSQHTIEAFSRIAGLPFVFKDDREGGKFYEFPLAIKRISNGLIETVRR